MQLTEELVRTCTGADSARAFLAVDPLNEVAGLYAISTVNRLGMFLANIGHETGNLHFNTELWGPTDAQAHYYNHPGLGNMYLGDDYKFRGRGWLQTTGRGNYQKLTQRLRSRWPQMQVPDFVLQPDLLAQSEWCAVSAADYWEMQSLNRYADNDDFDSVCDIINLGHKGERPGMANGFKDRLALWAQAKPALILAGFPLTVGE